MPITPKQLNAINATLINNEVVFNTNAAADDYVCVLNHRGTIKIEGPDAEKFMQGQLTCDVNDVTLERSALGAHCSPKGRAIASFRLVKTGEHAYLFGLPQNNTDTLIKSLRKYIVFSKAALNPADTICTLGLSGESAAQLISDVYGTQLSLYASVTTANGTAICIDHKRFELWLDAAQLTTLWPQIIARLKPTNTVAWYENNIRAQLVEIEASTSEELVPQMFKLDEHDGISFTKGCYTGQEIVARLKYLGKQKRQLTPFTHSNSQIATGDAVTNEADKNLGIVVAIAATSGLAVVSDKALEAGSATVQATPIQFEHGE